MAKEKKKKESLDKARDKEEKDQEGKPLCEKCGCILVEEEGELVCPECQGEIDFLGEDDES